MPAVVPAPSGATDSTKFDAADCWELLNGPTQFAMGLLFTRKKLPVILAGASGGTPNVGYPSMCSDQSDSYAETLVFARTTMAFA